MNIKTITLEYFKKKNIEFLQLKNNGILEYGDYIIMKTIAEIEKMTYIKNKDSDEMRIVLHKFEKLKGR